MSGDSTRPLIVLLFSDPMKKEVAMSAKHYVPGHGIHKASTQEEMRLDYSPKVNVEPHMGHLYLVIIAAIISFAMTQILKPFIWQTCTDKSNAVIRLVAVLIGAGVAYTLSEPLQIIDIWMGACAGALNAWVIKMFKAKVKSTIESSEEDD